MIKHNLFQQLSIRQWCWLCIAYWRLWPILVRIKFKQFFRSANWLEKKITFVHNNPQISTCDSMHAEKMHESVRLAARLHFFGAACLPKSIVLADMLSARGMDANVVIGVSKKGGELRSHAWVALDGAMVAEPESVQHEFIAIKRWK